MFGVSSPFFFFFSCINLLLSFLPLQEKRDGTQQMQEKHKTKSQKNNKYHNSIGVTRMSCQVNHCHAQVQRKKTEMGLDSTFAKSLCYEPEEIADVCLRFSVCEWQLINSLLNTRRITDRTHIKIFFTLFYYSITLFLYFQYILPIYCQKEYNCKLSLKQALRCTSSYVLLCSMAFLQHLFYLCFAIFF